MKHLFLIIGLVLAPLQGFASALVTITGTHYSSNDSEIGIQQGSKVYFVSRSVFSKSGQKYLINSESPFSIRVQMSDITRVLVLDKK